MGGSKEMWTAAGGFGVALVVFGATVLEAVRVDGAEAPNGSVAVADQADRRKSSADREPGEPSDTARTDATDPGPADGGEAVDAQSASGSLAGAPRTVEALVARSVTPPTPRSEIQQAVGQDVFLPARRAPRSRYVLPNQRTFVVERPERPDVDEPDFRIVGAARTATGGVALVQTDEDEPLVAVVVGESIEGYTLAAVTDLGARVERRGVGFDLSIREPEENRDDRRRSRRRDEERQLERAGEQIQQMQRLLQERVLQNGGGPLRFNNGPALGSDPMIFLDGARINRLPAGRGGRGGGQ